MDKIKKFLTDNKGCPLTTPAIKQLLVKFIESLSDEGLGELLSKVSVDDNEIRTDKLYLTDKLMLPNGILGICDDGGDPLFPLENNAGKVLSVSEDEEGFEAKDVSSMTLLGTGLLLRKGDGSISTGFTNIDITKITQKTLLIFTYANCFVLGMLSQTGEGRVAGNLVNDDSGNSVLGKIRFKLTDNNIVVDTNVPYGFTETPPTPYLFAFSII